MESDKMEHDKVTTLSANNFTKICIFEVAQNIYDNESFIQEHFDDLLALNDVVKEYEDEEFYEIGGSIEFNYHKVNISYSVYGSVRDESEFVSEFEKVIKKCFPNAKKVYDSRDECFINFGKDSFE